MKRCIHAGIIPFLILCTYSSFAQRTLVLRDDQNNIALSPYALVYTGSTSPSDIERLIHSDSSQFVRNNASEGINYGLDKTSAWCVFFVRNESNTSDWILKVKQSTVDTVLLYTVRHDTVVERFPITGHFLTLPERSVRSLPFAYNISIQKNETVAFYLYTARQYGRHSAALTFQTKDHFESYEYGFNVALGVVSGMVGLASFLGFFIFLFVRQRLYVYYSIYAASFFFALLADTGFSHAILFFPLDQTVANGFTMIFYYWMGGSLGIFSIELLELKQYPRRWVYWFGIIASYACCVIALLLLMPWLPQLIRWSFISCSYYVALILNVYILGIIILSIRKKNEPIVHFYMAGFFFTSLIAVLFLLSDFQIINFPGENKDFYYFTPVVEVVCVALGIGINFSKTLKERVNVQLTLNQTQDQIITIQENERRRIAQDLHDDVGNSLAAIKNMVIHKRESVSVEKEIDNLVNTIRSISHDLMPVDLEEFSLVEITAHTVNKFKDHPTLTLEFDSTGKGVRLKPLTELVIYRIVNELISNIMKHAQATSAFIQLIYQENSLVVTAEDNGIGIRNSKTEEGIGLRSIRLRAEYIHATLKIESDEKGTLIILEVPYESIH